MKRFLSLLLVAALVLSVPVAPVFAQTNTTAQKENVTPVTDACPCGCGKTIEEIEWTPLPTKYFGSAPEGHHYLTQDFIQGDYGTTIIAGTNVVIDLRGFTWTSSSTAARLFTVQGNLWIMDTVGGGKLAPKVKGVYGGGILIDAYETASPSFTLVSGTITAAEGSGLPGGAGFIYAWEDSRFIMLGGVIENIHAKDYGGAIMASGTASIEILGGTIRNCSVGTRGGAIYSASTTPVVVKNTTFINNTVNVNTAANNGGGAIYSLPQLTVENCTFMGNSSTANGGAIFAAAGMDVKNCTFIGNSANNGGDIHVAGTAQSVIDGCQFYGGYSTLNGGSILASAANLTIKNSQLTGAIADKQGGHIYQHGGNLTIEKCELNGGISNWAGAEGAIPYCGGGNLMVLAGTTAATTTIEDSVIRNGFSKARGGNIQLSTDTTTFTLKNSVVTGGVAKYRGNNIEAQSSMNITIDGSTIDGDVALTGNTKPITLKGKVNIGLRNNGLATGENANIDASGLTEGSEIYISGTGNLVAAGANMDYFKGAIRTALSAGEGGVIVGTAGTTGYCPHCGEIATWEVLQDLSEEESLSGHYYVSANSNANTDYTFNGVDVVIDLNGKTISDTSSRAFTTRITKGACTLSILDSAGNGFVKSYGPGAGSNAGVIFNNGTLNIYGGNYVNTDKGYAAQGGLIYNGGTLRIYGGFFDGSKYENTTESKGLGATVCVPDSKSATISAGHFVGGKALNGGNLYISTKANVEITGGTFVGGSASGSAGNIYFADGSTGDVSVKNAIIRNGKGTTSGGNIRAGVYATNTFENCYIADGSAGYGGNITVAGSNASFVDCVIYGGNATGMGGGNVYTAGLGGAIKLDGCLITGGTATGNGGNIMFNHGNHQVLGGEISYGTARIGGNIYAHAGNYATGTYVTTIKKNTAGEVPHIFGGSANYGGNLSVVGTMVLTDAVIYGGNAAELGSDIQLAKLTNAKADPKLTLGSGVTSGGAGAIGMIAPVTGDVFGQALQYTVSSGLNAEAVIVLEGEYGNPTIMAKNGVLQVAGAKGVDENGNTVWYADYSEAAEAVAAQGGIVKLYANAELNLTQDTFVDLNGYTATVTGNGKLLGMDTTGDSYDLPKGEVTFEGTSPVADKSIVYAPNGNKYVALVEGNAVSFHRLGADLTTVTINIDKNGVYFKGKFAADEKLKGMIDTYGIAVSLEGMPTNNNLANTHKSQFNGADMANGQTTSGVIITNILKDGLDAGVNAERGQKKIYASTYVTLNDGATVLMGDQADTAEDDVAWSLYDAFTRLDALIDENPTVFRRHTNDMRNYYEKWQDKGIANWVGENSNFVEPEEDDVIDVLMIGSSSCYYYVEEMASLAAAAGIKLRVCNVYYSGCPIDKYYRDWNNNYADYQYFDTTAEVQPDGTIKATRKVFGGGKTLEWCLAQGDWDIISMQSRGALVMRDYLKGVDHLEASDIKEATEFMFPYIQSQFPNAHLYLKEQGAYQVGKKLTVATGMVYEFKDLEDQQLYAAAQTDASARMVAKFNAAPYNLNMRVMATCQSAMLVREGFGQWEGYDQLCARIGFRPTSPDISFDANDKHEGDHGHVGDIGGGQYLEGAMWLQVIMQDYYDADFDVRDITWVPTYYYSGEVIPNRFDAEFMREAAYKAAKEGWTPPANFVSPVK